MNWEILIRKRLSQKLGMPAKRIHVWTEWLTVESLGDVESLVVAFERPLGDVRNEVMKNAIGYLARVLWMRNIKHLYVCSCRKTGPHEWKVEVEGSLAQPSGPVRIDVLGRREVA